MCTYSNKVLIKIHLPKDEVILIQICLVCHAIIVFFTACIVTMRVSVYLDLALHF